MSEDTTTADTTSNENTLVMEAELASLRQEIERLKVQLQASAHAASTSFETDPRPAHPKINIVVIVELLATFDGTAGNYEIWERQLKLLKRTYKLDDEHTKVLVGIRLKGKVAEWLHSRPELIEVSMEALLCELKPCTILGLTRCCCVKNSKSECGKRASRSASICTRKSFWEI